LRIQQLKTEEAHRACQLMEQECQRAKQKLQETIKSQRIRQLEMVEMLEKKKNLEGSSGMSMEEEGIGCSSSAVPGSPRLAKGTHSCTAPED
jgi:hypothetical protein